VRRLLLIVALACGCGSRLDGGSDPTHDDVNPADRKILGVPEPYPADPGLRDRQDELDSAMRTRRQIAWATVQKVLQPIALTDPTLGASVPRFQTWYAKDDFVRMFKKLYLDLGTAGRKARGPFSDEALVAIFPWNATMVDQLASWPADRYAQYLARLQNDLDVQGEGAGHRVSYSPSVMSHLFRNYAGVLDCLPRLPALDPAAPPVSSDNFTACYASEFPVDAAVVKAQWVRAEFGAKLGGYVTGADGLTRRIADGAAADWGDGDTQEDPGADRIHTARLSNGNVFRLAGLHIMTKELRKWLWITLWWSPDPDSDFGADRPVALDGVWRNYKMCVVSAADEKDPAPTDAFADLPSLQAALGATGAIAGTPSWCSNPYLEKGAGNARTNCIGCHQHAGTALTPEQILADPTRFPDNGRREVRANFPTDYLWALQRTDNLGAVVSDEAAYYDSFEKGTP
jgi:hypothetical protein